MKKIFMMMAASALVLGGCTNGEVDFPQPNEKVTVCFSAGNLEVRSTRATEQVYSGVIAASNDAGTTWEENFPLGSLIFKGNLVGDGETYATLTVSGDKVVNNQIQLTPTNAEYFYSFGVAGEDVLTRNGNVYTIAATAPANNIANDYIWDNEVKPLEANNPNPVTVQFDYKHVMSKLCIVLYEAKDNTTVKVDDEKVKISQLSNLGLVRNGVLDITKGVVEKSTDITTLTELDIENGDNTGIEYFVIPQKTTNEATFRLAYNNAVYDVKVPAGSEFKAGYSRVFKLTLKGSGIDFSAKLYDWEDDIYEVPSGDMIPVQKN